MKASFMSLKLGFDKAIGEGGRNRRQIRIAPSILRDVAVAFILRGITVAGSGIVLHYAVAIFIVYRGWSRTASSAGPGYKLRRVSSADELH